MVSIKFSALRVSSAFFMLQSPFATIKASILNSQVPVFHVSIFMSFSSAVSSSQLLGISSIILIIFRILSSLQRRLSILALFICDNELFSKVPRIVFFVV
jgi:hypothetical protein